MLGLPGPAFGSIGGLAAKQLKMQCHSNLCISILLAPSYKKNRMPRPFASSFITTRLFAFQYGC